MIYPLAIGGACIITSIIGTYFVRLGSDGGIMWAMYKGVIVAAVLSIPAIWFVTNRLVGMDTVIDGRRPARSPACRCSGARWSASPSPA